MKISQNIINIYLKLPRKPKAVKGKINVACIGDSLTRGAGVRGKKKLTWEYFLNEKLGERYNVINCGISGCTLQKEGDCPYVDSTLFPYTLDLKADIYLVMLGSNDTKPQNWNEENYRRQLKDFLKGYMSLDNKPRVIAMIPVECYPEESTGKVAFNINKDVIDNVLPKIIKETAEELDIETIDLLTPTINHEEWYADGVHPNGEGNRYLADFIFEHLK